ncbi:TPA: hypothetical protein ACHORA_004588 [Escherichia coli]
MLGGVIWKALPGSIEIRTYNGSLANMVWWQSERTLKNYAISYNHNSCEIEMRDESVKGAVLFSISNETTPEKILSQLSEL